MPIMRRLAEQTTANEALKLQIAELQDELNEARATNALPSRDDRKSRHLSGVLLCAGLSLFLLLVIHYLFVIKFDINTVFLRVASVVVPMVVASSISSCWRAPMGLHLVVAPLLGIASVMMMAGVVSVIDHVPWLPTTKRDVFEFAEYILSIALAHIAGILTARAISRLLERRHRNASRFKDTAPKAEQAFRGVLKVHELWEAAAPLLATGGALWAGLRAIVRGD